jgi:hypothetical protein
MSNPNLILNNSKVSQIEANYFLPVSQVYGNQLTSVYAFMGQEDPWPVVNGSEVPSTPVDTEQYKKKIFKNMIAVKQVGINNISPVIQRIDWTANTVYVAYSDVMPMAGKNEAEGGEAEDINVYNFYVRNKYDQVFKCLWNNNGGPSLYEPFFQPGTYGTNNIFSGAGDGYKWKYMYTIDAGSKKTFMDSTWMPVPVGLNTPQPYLTTAGTGDIEVINVTNGGTGYDAVNSYIVVTITGDGQGAVANITSAQITNGSITDIIVRPGFAGNNYTYANVSVTAYTSANLKYTSTLGSGVTAVAPISPVGGHGYDPISELGCNHIMFTCEFNGTEGGTIPVSGVTYRQIGLLISPQVYGTFNGSPAPLLANGAIYNTTTQLTVSAGAGALYTPDELAVEYDANGNALFQGTVVSFDSTTNILQLINTTGYPSIGFNIKGTSSGASRTVFNVSNSALIPFSGYLTYVENRPGIQRSADSIEQFKFVLGY